MYCPNNSKCMCTLCNERNIRYALMCAHCGLKKKDHYTSHHTFVPLKSPSCEISTASPFDPTDIEISGYDPMAQKYYPPSLQ